MNDLLKKLVENQTLTAEEATEIQLQIEQN